MRPYVTDIFILKKYIHILGKKLISNKYIAILLNQYAIQKNYYQHYFLNTKIIIKKIFYYTYF